MCGTKFYIKFYQCFIEMKYNMASLFQKWFLVSVDHSGWAYNLVISVLIYWTRCRYGAVVMDDQRDDGSLGYTVLHNSSCQHAAPTFINLMNAAILRLASRNENMTIQTRNHPLPMTQSQHLQRHVCSTFLISNLQSIQWYIKL